MLHKRFIYRLLLRSPRQAVLFVLCVVLSMVVLVALNGFSESVDRSMASDARTLQGGDVVVRSRFALSPQLVQAVRETVSRNAAAAVRTWEFYSMAMALPQKTTLLSRVKVVEAGYPLYGTVSLESGRPFGEMLQPGAAIVDRLLLERLGLKVGDGIRLGRASLAIRDVVVSEPDRPVTFFSFGPRIFVSAADLAAMDLVGKGSRITYRVMLKTIGAETPQEMVKRLTSAAVAGQEQVDTFRTAGSRLQRFYDNFFFFLNLVGSFTLVLAGIGMYSSLTAYLRDNERTIAILKTVGATSRFIMLQYLCVLVILGLAGTLGGIGAGIAVEHALPLLFTGMLPDALEPVVSLGAVGQGFVLGLFIVALFAFLPVYRLTEIKPAVILRKEPVRFRRSLATYGVVAAIAVFFAVVIVEKMEDLKTAAIFIAGIAGLVGVTALFSGPLLWLLKKTPIRSLATRQAVRGLFRPGNATRPVIVTMTASLSFIFAIYLVEQNLNRAFIASYPPQAPNLFFLDIQPDQKAGFTRLIGAPLDFYPIVRARILSVNDRPVDPGREQRRRRDNLGRTFNLTYRHHLLDDETIVAGGDLFPEASDGIPVSILDTVAEIPDPPMAMGDRITFRIQGVPLTATVTSIRSRTRESLSPFFYFVFPEAVLAKAPQTAFAAVRVPPGRIAGLQNRVVAAFPNITVIDVTASAQKIAVILKKLSTIVRFFTLFSIVAGVLLIISSIYATRFARIQETVYYKILGARGGFVMRVFTVENLLIGLVCGGLAVFLAQAGSWAICRFMLNVPYHPYLGTGLLLILAAMFIALAAGLVPSLSIIRQKPMGFLKEQTDE